MWNSRNVFNGRQFVMKINLLWKLIRIPVEFHRLIYHRHMHQNVKWVLKSNQMQLHSIMKKSTLLNLSTQVGQALKRFPVLVNYFIVIGLKVLSLF